MDRGKLKELLRSCFDLSEPAPQRAFRRHFGVGSATKQNDIVVLRTLKGRSVPLPRSDGLKPKSGGPHLICDGFPT